MRAAYPQAVVEVWSQDEARLGLKPIVRRVWARRGRAHRPLCAGDHRYQWMYVYGFVHPASGETVELETPLPEACTGLLDALSAAAGHAR